MSPLEPVLRDFLRAVAAFEGAIAETAGWSDELRAQLERRRVEPVRQAAKDFRLQIGVAVDEQVRAEQILRRPT